MPLDKSLITAKREVLDRVKIQLKTEFFGLDEIIEKIVDSLSAWYIFPEIITRPVIINLWGMTGVGKTQLVRRIVSLLDFNTKFVEIQMDGGSIKAYGPTTISSVLLQSSIDEGTPGILLLDEIQRYRTVDDNDADVAVERYQDVWTLLSDGKFSSDSSVFDEIEMLIAQQDYDDGKFLNESDEDEDSKPKKKTSLYPYEAKNLKKLLRLQEPISEILSWSTSKIAKVFHEFCDSRTTWEIDYSKLVIFISGNLDTAFIGATSTDDSDTDADYYHEVTKNITSNEIKANLEERFRPEQISRMGNNHIIYPSMSKSSYQKLIKATCLKYTDEMSKVSDISFTLDQKILDEIYNNAVFPTQGTRPVFSSIHKIFSNLLVNATFWAIENDEKSLSLFMHDDEKHIVVNGFNSSASFPVELEMNENKKKTSADFKALVAVHESGHAVIYSLLTKSAPFEVKVNTSQFKGGYILDAPSDEAETKLQCLDSICIMLAGRAAEELIYGKENITSGAQSDIVQATNLSSNYVRRFGFENNVPVLIDGSAGLPINWVTSIQESDIAITNIITRELARAKKLLSDNSTYFGHVVNMLIKTNSATQKEFIELSVEYIKLGTSKQSYPFLKQWEDFIFD